MSNRGFVYILSHEKMPNLLKIGRTIRSPEERAYELNSTGVPGDFIIEYHIEVDKHELLESKSHLEIPGRVAGKEFFECSLNSSITIIENIVRLYKLKVHSRYIRSIEIQIKQAAKAHALKVSEEENSRYKTRLEHYQKIISDEKSIISDKKNLINSNYPSILLLSLPVISTISMSLIGVPPAAGFGIGLVISVLLHEHKKSELQKIDTRTLENAETEHKNICDELKSKIDNIQKEAYESKLRELKEGSRHLSNNNLSKNKINPTEISSIQNGINHSITNINQISSGRPTPIIASSPLPLGDKILSPSETLGRARRAFELEDHKSAFILINDYLAHFPTCKTGLKLKELIEKNSRQ